MQHSFTRPLAVSLAFVSVLVTAAWAAPYRLRDVTIVVPDNAPGRAAIAAAELRGYVYRLTGVFPPVAANAPEGKLAIVLRTGAGDRVPTGGPDTGQNFVLYVEDGRQIVHGASDYSTLWAAYQLIESWGVGFYLGGDLLPKQEADRTVETVEGQFKPVLAIRGNLPWFNFQNSPTTWNPQDYKTFFAQMAKQKANLIGFHAYDHEPFGAYDITNAGAKMGGPLMTTISAHRWWSPPAMSTKDFLFGTDLFFDRGEWGCEVGIDDAWTFAPGRATRLQQQMMAEALTYAKRLGIRTCLGWEVTGNPGDPNTAAAFRKRLTHTLATYPLDYVWIWQSEGRGTAGEGGNPVAGARNDASIVPDEKIKEAFAYLGANHDLREAKRIAQYVLLAHRTMKELAPNVRLVVSGWGGDTWMRFSSLYDGLDKVVPDDVIFASLDNIDPRFQPNVSASYGHVKPQRERWPIPWFESDGGGARMDQTGPSTNVTAFEPVLKDIVAKGCQGALGIHWRTRNIEDVAGYLYRFGWNDKLTAAEFFKGYARDCYGPEEAERMAKVHLRLEEFGPQYVGAAGTVECSTPFQWFHAPGAPDKWREANRAGQMPDESRFPELEAMAKDLMERSGKAMSEGRRDAAMRYHDLACTIQWLVTRAKVGLAIWNATAPLEQRLRTAERLMEQGKMGQGNGEASASPKDELDRYRSSLSRAHKEARRILKDLEALDFEGAFRGMAASCRTRGELGMLATANARYGRFYATFVQRLAHILGRPLPEFRGPENWTGPETVTVFLTPSYLGVDQAISFDVVALPARPDAEFAIQFTDLKNPSAGSDDIPLQRLGGSCYRAVFFPPGAGTWPWRLICKAGGFDLSRSLSATAGVITFGPPAGPVQAAYRPAKPQAAIGQKEPVLKIDFDEPLGKIGEVVGKAKQCEGVRGKALDTREGGFLRIGKGSEPAGFTGPFTIAFFARPEKWDRTGEMPVLLCKGDFAGHGWLVQLYQGQVRVCIGQARCLDAATLKPGKWTHVAITYDGQVLTLFLDGKPAGSAEFEGPPAASSLPLRLGVYQEPGEGNPQVSPFRGCLDELTFYNRPLRVEEIVALARR